MAPLHLGLAAASLVARLGPPLAQLAPLLRGGMEGLAEGLDAAGQPVRARRVLLAEAGDGPVIPTLPALAALRAPAEGRLATPGAASCHLPLPVLELEFAPCRITTSRSLAPRQSPFAAALGPAFAALPAPVQAWHSGRARLAMAGEAEVMPATAWPARLLAAIFGLPRRAGQVAVRVTREAEGEAELWTRYFGPGRPMRSQLHPGRRPGEVEEHFGPFRFTLALAASPEGLALRPVGWRLGSLPLPAALAPRGVARESVDAAGRFRFDVPIGLALLGPLVRYRGWLCLAEPGFTSPRSACEPPASPG